MKHTLSYIKNHPRPTLTRPSFKHLNGEWQFFFDYENVGIERKYHQGFETSLTINVPFAYQSKASGIYLKDRCDTVWYQRNFKRHEAVRTLLHFEGSDDHTMVWLNGHFVGENLGGYHRFTFDITPYLQEDNLIVVRAHDDYDTQKPRGKQKWQTDNFGCWYTETTGIWKPVWLEYLNHTYLDSLLIKPSLDDMTVTFDYVINGFQPGVTLELDILFDGISIQKSTQLLSTAKSFITLPIKTDSAQFKVHTWRLGEPNLYDVVIRLSKNKQILDEAKSYFGFTKWQTINRGIYLNDEPIYLKMLLDQGYYESDLTPKDEAEIMHDIQLTIDTGFNGIRKHQKIEDDRFYYYCDILGMVSWLEMPSSYEFGRTAQDRFINEWTKIVRQHQHHPSIMSYVIFNESWGLHHIKSNKAEQQFSLAMYHLTKTLDPTRFAISNDGWEHTKSDLITIHHYAQTGEQLSHIYKDMALMLNNGFVKDSSVRQVFAEGFYYNNEPVLISEYGGIAFSSDTGWGYGEKVATKEAFIERLDGLTKAIKNMPSVSGYCLTQTTDVEQEVNGIFTRDRKPKVDMSIIKKINIE